VVVLLVEVGNAQLDEQDDEGWTALHCAAAQEDELETAKYLVAHGCSLDVENNDGREALDLATDNNHPELVQFLSSASNLITNNDYYSLRSLCAPHSSAPFLSLSITRELRYNTILAVHRARRLIDDYGDTAPVLPLLRRLAIAPSGDNSTPNTESQVLRRIISFVGTGFDYVGEEVEQQLAHMMRDVMIPLQQDNGAQAVTIAALQRANAALQRKLADLTAA
jgi:hypothetical protein